MQPLSKCPSSEPLIPAAFATMSGNQASFPPAGSGAQTSFPPPSGTARMNPVRPGPTAAQALRALLGHTDEAITPALAALRASELARLHDLVGSTVFGLIVNTQPSVQDAPPAQRDPWADITDPVRVEPGPVSGPVQPDPPAQPNPVLDDPLPDNEYMWRDPVPPLSPRRALRGPWTPAEGWLINPVLPSVQCTMIRPAWWPYPDIFCLRPCEIGATALIPVPSNAVPLTATAFASVRSWPAKGTATQDTNASSALKRTAIDPYPLLSAWPIHGIIYVMALYPVRWLG